MRLAGWIIAASFVAVTGGAACSLLDSASQCASDGDCARFSARCDLSQSICVGGTTGEPETRVDGSVLTAAALPNEPPLDPKCAIAPKPTANPASGLAPTADGGAQVAQSLTLGCEKDWLLEGPLVVGAGATLTIAAGTTIKAKKGVGAAIIVQRGARIVAQGQRNAPIVMTVDDPLPKAGDWRGLFVLGNAPRSGGGNYTNDPLLAHGGNVPDDDSGVLSFVRIEYSNDALVLGSIGSKTRIDSVQVRHTNDGCFALFGGRVDAKHLVCQRAADDLFELREGYAGRLQFLFGQQVNAGDGHHGLLVDGANTAPTVYNVTLCGQAPATTGQSYGITIRNNARFDANNAVVTGWFSGLEAVGAIAAPTQLRGSVFFDNATNPVAVEDGGAVPADNDDNGFDELALFLDAGSNSEANANLTSCHDPKSPKPWPGAALTSGARTPPAEFFDPTASYAGAFKDANDPWMTGWTRFDDK